MQRVGEDRSRFEPVPQRQQELVASFITAAREGDLAGLEKLLAADATWWSDGGGKVSAARRPVHGREKVGRLALGAYEKWAAGVEFTMAEINGASTLVAWAGDTLVAVLALDLREGLITDVWAQVNPDKLEFLRRRLTRP